MPCDGRNDNCRRRRELLTQLKCIVDSMDRKKPCEWDKPSAPPPINICKDVPPQQNSFECYIPIKDTKSVFLRGSVMHRCECIKRNGLQDRCMMWDCMGKPECMTKLYPICEPGQKALSKFMEHGDVNAALEKLIAADKARELALANYCKLVGPEVNNDGIERLPPAFISPPSTFSTSPSPKDPRTQLKHQRMYNNQQPQRLQQPYPPMQGAQLLRQEPIYQQPMSYSHTQEQQHQHQHHHHFHPQYFEYPTSFTNNQPAYPPHQEHSMNQRYQFQMPAQFVQQPPSPPPPNPPYIQNNFLPC
ncbi:uncharacterized protein [Chelonus insularis]|uniref:uncharacterized protein n=1 Tax=Chelonus insularis TaxID=460826 RepID=UPI00158D5ECA|nr:uncharacterized protein LOC118074094 [Chelonus insularis]